MIVNNQPSGKQDSTSGKRKEGSKAIIPEFPLFQEPFMCLTYGGNPPKRNLFIKKLCIYSYMFKLQSPSKYSPFEAIHLLRFFFPQLETVFELNDFDAF